MEKGEKQLAKFHISEGMGSTKSDWKDCIGISAGSIGDLKIFQCISALEMWAWILKSNLV